MFHRIVGKCMASLIGPLLYRVDTLFVLSTSLFIPSRRSLLTLAYCSNVLMCSISLLNLIGPITQLLILARKLRPPEVTLLCVAMKTTGRRLLTRCSPVVNLILLRLGTTTLETMRLTTCLRTVAHVLPIDRYLHIAHFVLCRHTYTTLPSLPLLLMITTAVTLTFPYPSKGLTHPRPS